MLSSWCSPTNRTWCSTSSIGVQSRLGILSQLGIHIFHLRIAVGMVHSMAILLKIEHYFIVSSDPHLRCQQLYSLCEKTIVSISAGNDVYMWDGKKSMDKPPIATRLHRVKGKKIP
ncbi:hypothetical protein ES288_D09G059100v1 [Gossypium darwinii]|uniref:Uncharacterized protein n=1 Tax=Gossypium darwinii TaxID=34276 RepID=A0A5D2B7C6_GOSDA|nr:hypothetical protein ES288_D09G059100v1 [Gossypium darwinii]